MSPTEYGAPTLYEATPFPGTPPCFVRIYDLARSRISSMRITDTGEILIGEPGTPLYPEGGQLVICGYSCRSTYSEDWPREVQVWEHRRAFPSVCFSRLERNGEYGSTPIAECVMIERTELESLLRQLGVSWVRKPAGGQ